MRINYYDLHEGQFEDLATAICKNILGTATQKFTKGKDGGRDARFSGTANLYPSKAKPHSGNFIVQAKHTFNPTAKMSDSDFFSLSGNGIIWDEISTIKKLIQAGEVDHYILFTNRRDSANKMVEIEKLLLDLNLKSAKIYGIDNIDMFLKQFPSVLALANIDYMDAPIRVIPDELAEVILALKDSIKDIASSIKEKEKIDRVAFDKKSRLNNMPVEYKDLIIRNYLKEFDKVDEFLANPANEDLQSLYIETADEFNFEVLERINDTSINKLLNDLIHRLFYRDIDLKRNKKLTRTVIYYMFWKCDVGRKN